MDPRPITPILKSIVVLALVVLICCVPANLGFTHSPLTAASAAPIAAVNGGRNDQEDTKYDGAIPPLRSVTDAANGGGDEHHITSDPSVGPKRLLFEDVAQKLRLENAQRMHSEVLYGARLFGIDAIKMCQKPSSSASVMEHSSSSHSALPSSSPSLRVVGSEYLPCILNNGCVCNHTLPYFNWNDLQYYGTCTSCAAEYTGPTCADRLVECQNFGEKINGTCHCTPEFTGYACEQHLCINSKGGDGNYSVAPPDYQNYCRDCKEGFTGISCDMCDADVACGEGSYCSQDPMFLYDNHKLNCEITDPDIVDELEWGKRKVAANIVANCTSHTNWTDDSGFCSVTLYRQEYINIPSQLYIDPFFFCTMFECSVTESIQQIPQPNDPHRDEIFRVVKISGMVVLLVFVLCVSLAKYIPLKKQYQRLPVKISLGLLLIGIVAYIIALESLMGSTPTKAERQVKLHCNQASCTCGPNSRLINDTYAPNCNETSFASLILPNIKGNIDFTCNDAGICAFEPRDLTVSLPLKCTNSECVPNGVRPAKPESIEEQMEISGYIAGGVVGFIIVCGLVHYVVSRYLSRKAATEFAQIQFSHEADLICSEAARATGFSQAIISGEEGEQNPTNSNSGGAATDPTEYSVRGPNSTSYESAQLIATSPNTGINRHTRTFSSGALPLSANASPAGSNGSGGLAFKALSSCELSVVDLSYTVRTQPWPPHKLTEDNSKPILFNITMGAQSGDVVALMGSSGAGKTTLLDILAARGKMGVTSGEIRLNGTLVGGSGRAKGYRGLVGYVSQEDTLLPHLTVRETLRYAAQLKLPSAFTAPMINAVVDGVIDSLKLQRCAETIIGDGQNTRGLSGGEKRRVSIGAELVANPRILFLDEPTSGLDAANALNVMEVVAELAKESPLRKYAPRYFSFNPIIVASIHQPSKAILKRFTKVVLLSRGKMIYAGDVSLSATSLLSQLSPATASAIQDCAEGDDNPAEVLLAVDDHITDDERNVLAEWAHKTENDSQNAIRNRRKSSGSAEERGGSVGEEYPEEAAINIIAESRANKRFYINIYGQFALLVRRAYASLMGAYYLVAAHGLVAFVMGLLMCLLYQSQPLTLPGTLNRAGSVTFLLLVQSFISLSALEQLMTEKKLFVTERENGFYSTLPYLLSKVVVDIVPLRVIPSVFVSSLIYFPMGLRMDEGSHFLWFIFIIALFTCTITMLVVCIGAVSQSFGSAALVAAVLILWNFVFGGLLVQSQTIPEGFAPFKNVSPFYFAFEALMVNELKGQMCEFSPTNDAGQPSDLKMNVFCIQYIYNLGLKPDRFGIDVVLLATECIIFVIIAYILMTFVRVTR